MNPPPLPAPHRFTCDRCGFGFDEPSEFCPRCGAAQTAKAKRDASPGTMLAYGCGALFLGSLGFCLVIPDLAPHKAGVSTAFGFAAFAFALFCIWKFFRGGN